ncbi:CBL-interacting serine/threonine-protein kinase 5-like isoform X2 [Diospyros lotus]|uniref:CBL-interacting serine/threonine-protein kinase 5-like isoform X2 n=1 Tax=Diospyros lotus TaxID=55363 RepID=UPI0022546B9F|nr:CBL-interacting serine/threonine-protein kinase 5-like isoform X2 [Diospyros lotus]
MEETTQTLFGKYERGRLLGKGTFAKVYYGKHLVSGEDVAIKVINKKQVKEEGMVEQILREISVTRLVRHPNVVELKEVMANKAKIFLVMEYVNGGELFAKVAKGKLSEALARKYFQQLISAVDFCHSRGVYHRDLKPENLLLDEHEDLKVSDFGLSALPEQRWNDGLLHTQCGTPAYVAPEVLRKKGYDGAKADIWSCGAEFEYPPWISWEARRLISKLLVADPERRITIPAIMRETWFRKGFARRNSFSIRNSSPLEEQSTERANDEMPSSSSSSSSSSSPSSSSSSVPVLKQQSSKMKKSASTPSFLNAFEFISSMSSGFDLSSLFENKRKSKSMFTSRSSATTIVDKIEEVAKGLSFKVAKVQDFKLRLQGETEGRKGPLSVAVEVFEVATDQVAVVEFSKTSGDTLEYAKFCEEDVRPALKDIVWTWQGDTNSNNGDHFEGDSCEDHLSDKPNHG